MDAFPSAEIAGLFSEAVAVSVLYVKCVFKIPQIDNREYILYLFIVQTHRITNIERGIF